jgi:hypothetical protein
MQHPGFDANAINFDGAASKCAFVGKVIAAMVI